MPGCARRTDRKLSVSLTLLDNVRSMNRDGPSVAIMLVILPVLPAFQASHIWHHDLRHGEEPPAPFRVVCCRLNDTRFHRQHIYTNTKTNDYVTVKTCNK